MQTKVYEISISSLYSGSAVCKDIELTWETPYCANIKCELDDDKSTLIVTVPEDCDDTCIYVNVKCLDLDCSYCPDSERIKICLCTEEEDCQSCEDCINGLCVSTCEEDEICLGGDVCGDCDDENPCTDGKVCVNGKCVCPDETPVEHPDTGICVECIPGTVDGCRVCDPDGMWQPYECVDGKFCDPDSENEDPCVECLTNTDCEDPNAICNEEGDCVCKPGFEKDADGNCVESPECKKNSDCGDPCKFCDQLGNCQDIIAETGPCAPEIECPTAPCENGIDCGGIGDCGCFNKKCVDCSEFPQALGCDVDQHDPPTGCDDGEDCDPGFGCFNGDCVDCDNFTFEQRQNIPGCETDADTCKDVNTLVKGDCNAPLTSKLVKTGFCQCEAIGTSIQITGIAVTGSEDEEIYTGTFVADLRKGYHNNEFGYEAKPLFTNQEINNEIPTQAQLSLKVIPVYKYTKQRENGTYYTTFYEGTEILSTLDLSEGVVTQTKGTFDPIEIGRNSGVVRDDKGRLIEGTFITGYKVRFSVGQILFENNCTYPAKTLFSSPTIFSVVSDASRYIKISKLQTALGNVKFPLLTWKRDGTVFRKFYIQPDVGTNTFEDILYGPEKFVDDDDRGKQTLLTPEGEIIPLSKYEAEYDCTCDPVRSIDKLVICDIDENTFKQDVHFKVDSQPESDLCNDRVTIIQDFIPCDINKDLKGFGWDDTTVSASQTKYILKVNGEIKGTFRWSKELEAMVNDNQPSQAMEGFVVNMSEIVEKVSIEMNHKSSCKTSTDIKTELFKPSFETSCEAGGLFSVEFTPDPRSAISEIKLGDISRLPGNLVFSGLEGFTPDNKVEHTFSIIYGNNCTETMTISKDVCSDCQNSLSVSLNNIYGSPNNLKKVVVSTENKDVLTSIKIGSEELIGSFVNDGNNVYSFSAFSTASTTITVTAVTEEGCTIIGSNITVPDGSVEDVSFQFVPNPTLSDSDGEFKSIFPGVVVEFTLPDDSTVELTTDVNGDVTLENQTQAGEYRVTKINGIEADLRDTLVVLEGSSVSSFTKESGPYCEGQNVEHYITGTEGAFVEISFSDGRANTDVQLGSGTFTYVYVPTTTGSQTVTLERVYQESGGVEIPGSSVTLTGLSQTFTVESLPVIAQVTAVCQASSPGAVIDYEVQATADSTVEISWDEGGNWTNMTQTGAGTGIYQVSSTNDGSYTVRVTSSAGCIVTQSGNKAPCECNPVAQPDLTTDSQLYFTTTEPVSTVSLSGGTSTRWYSDSELSTEIVAASGNLSYTPTDGISQRIYVVAEDGSGCQSDPVEITYNKISIIPGAFAATNATINGSNISVCQGETSTVSLPSVAYQTDLGFNVPNIGTDLNYNWTGTASGLATDPQGVYASDAGSVSVTLSSTVSADTSLVVNFTIIEATCAACVGYNIELDNDNLITCVDGADSHSVQVTVNNSLGTQWTYQVRDTSGNIVWSTGPTSNNPQLVNIDYDDWSDGGTWTIRAIDNTGDACGSSGSADQNFELDLVEATVTVGTYDPIAGEFEITVNGNRSNPSRFVRVKVYATGTEIYNRQWSSGSNSFSDVETITGLGDGTYNLTFDVNAGCTQTIDPTYVVYSCGVGLNAPSSTGETCNGESDGTITLSGTGAVSYEYSINNGGSWQSSGSFTGLAPGTYPCQARDADYPECESTVTNVVIGGGTSIVAMTTITDESCEAAGDGSIAVNTSGTSIAAADLEYEISSNPGVWQTSVTYGYTFGSLPDGTYTVTVRDSNLNSCFIVKSGLVVGAGSPAEFTIEFSGTILGTFS